MGSLAPPPAVYLVAAALVLVPLSWHTRARNIPALALAFWIAQDNLFLGINAIMWNGSVERKHLIYCDITLALNNASIFGQVAAALCVARNLERISSPGSIRNTSTARKRAIFELLLCVVFPFVFAALHLIVQPNRFDIYEDIGCRSTVWMTWPAVVLYILPPLLLSITTATYAVLAIQWFVLRRGVFQKVLSKSSPGMSQFQFYRLLAMAAAQACVTVASSIYGLVSLLSTVSNTLNPWPGWQNLHFGFHVVYQFPAALLSEAEIRSLNAYGYVQPLAALLFFLLFGLTSDILGDGQKAWRWIEMRVLHRTSPRSSTSKSNPAQTIQSFSSKSVNSPKSSTTPPGLSPEPPVPRVHWTPHVGSGIATGQHGSADWSQGSFTSSHTSNGSESKASFAFTTPPATPRPRSLVRPVQSPPLMVDGVRVHLPVGGRSPPSSFQPSIAAHSPPHLRSALHTHTRSTSSTPRPGFI